MSNNKDRFKKMHDKLTPDSEAVDELFNRIEKEKEAAPRKVGYKKYITAAAACLAVTIVAAIAIPRLGNGYTENLPSQGSTEIDSFPSTSSVASAGGDKTNDTVGGREEITHNEVATVPKWETLPISEKYTGIEFLEKQYDVSSSLPCVDASLVTRLGETEAFGFDIYADEEKRISCAVFEINGIDSRAAVAVEYNEEGEYYPFICAGYRPETLGEFIDAFGLEENLTFSTVYCEKEEDGKRVSETFSLSDVNAVLNILFANRSALNEGDAHYASAVTDLAVDIDVLGIKNISLAVNDEGYLQTNIGATGKSFFIGTKAAEEFTQYVRENGTLLSSDSYDLPDEVTEIAMTERDSEATETFSEAYTPNS